MNLEGHYQNGYVTRNLDKAMEVFKRQYGVENFFVHEGPTPIKTPAGETFMDMRIAMGWVGHLQYELIQPVSGYVDCYREALPDDDSVRFHHICMRVPNWEAFRNEVDQKGLKVVHEGGMPGKLQFIYLDTRATLGHYLEYTWSTPEMWAATGGPR
jgi:hypothetical protein